MSTTHAEQLEIAVAEVGLLGADLSTSASGGPLVVFAHGSGSSRHSPRNQAVARHLQRAGLGTLLLDLLTQAEELAEQRGAMLRFDVDVLAQRLVGAVEWLDAQPALRPGAVGYFGASTGAAGAAAAAARQGDRIGAIVSRGGRPDLAETLLPLVSAPTLLIVGSLDPVVLEKNRQALEQLRCERELEVVRGATHLFEEPGTLEQVAELAVRWFSRHLAGDRV